MLADTKSFQFYTNELTYEEVGTKSDKQHYIKGYISTDEIDRVNEVVTRNAMQEMVDGIKNGNVKLDIEHSQFTGEADIPVGKILDAGIDSKGVWVKCVLNNDHNKFKEVWKSIKNGFLDAFSIAYQVKETAREVIDGVQVTLLKSLELLNVAITGNPVNKGARMTESFLKSIKHIEEKNMKTQVELKDEPVAPVVTTAPVAEPVAEPTPAVTPEPAPAPVAEPAKVEESFTLEQVNELVDKKVKEALEAAKPTEPVVTPEVVPEPTPSPLDAIKSTLEVENLGLKSEVNKLLSTVDALTAKLKAPQLKALGNTQRQPITEKTGSPMSFIK